MAIKLWWNLNGTWTDPNGWSGHAPPRAGDLDIIESGTVKLTNVDTSYQTIWLDALSASSPAEIDVVGSLGTGSYVLLTPDNNLDFVKLNNTAMNGIVFAQSGNAQLSIDAGTSAVNYGLIAVASTTKAGVIMLADQGPFANVGKIEVGANGSFALQLGHEAGNFGTIQVDPGGAVALNAYADAPATTGTFDNHGLISINSGGVSVGGNLTQDTGSIDITNNGSLTLTGATNGGIITIESGMLDFVGPRIQAPIPYLGAYEFKSVVEFTGLNAILSFGTTTGLGERYDASTDKLFITAPFEGMQQTTGLIIQLSGAYSASQFSVSGSTIVYTAHPTS